MSEFVVRQRLDPERDQSLPVRKPAPRHARLQLQPRYGLLDGGLVAYEATLLRAGMGQGAPDHRSLVGDGMMLRQACHLAASRTSHMPALSMRINGAQSASGMLDRMITEAIAECGLPPDRLELEFCIESLQSDEAELRRLLSALRASGIGVVLAGYGMPICGLTLLRTRGVAGLLSAVKLEWPHIRSLDQAAAITCGLIATAHALGIGVIAAGIDHEADARRLRDAGCDQGVGTWLGAAKPATEIATFYRLAGAPVALNL